ncbi:alkanesulfonate monooxygenase SsuD/methylene tetrahydromethanopterin reductase-like flavin-dependent oxidoreductase (luciferase family) [Actinoplanes lutulentus]|uniref:Luciferase family oxidoreductase group 1 n=1 Tax=Actinoplanes lutulentus TaxID=1287878 RepID=A0A327Z5M5_9ACTN|nr:LLM class flavin-dependent oxidoreductase [Actinoplanes lutulentus]MBB2946920.1 alkanesulfonate monooxygenase SsuD/methylene tetrahydromethanopterin reductase-like flavin-dependent oxidoreductase (luciferase family) [Actinoplanes lutulentus]RAK30423.1 luciferase family oxidoreductase group 1 [Actinoplanes lutulentus]
MTTTPLAVLDLIPLSSGDGPAEAVRNAIDLAQHTERLGYQRYWFAEHHLNPGVLGASPAVSIALVAGATSTIRVGSAGVQLGHRQPLAIVEEFGLLDAAYPGRLDLGLGRSIGRQKTAGDAEGGNAEAVAAYLAKRGNGAHTVEETADNGLLLPKQYDFTRLLTTSATKIATQLALLQQPGAYTPDYTSQISDILAFLAGTYTSPAGVGAHAYPGEGAAIQVWILGASGGASASVAGEKGLRFVASYHHSPSTVIDAVSAYRKAFRPSAELAEPHISVSADVVVGDTDAHAAELAAGYGLWVRSIRKGSGAIPFPTPEQAARHEWSEQDRELVRDRTETQLTGSPRTVADRLEQLRDATGAHELAITTITHDHTDRVRSYQLLAEEWSRR